jgi:hypothetical protein
VAEAGKPPTSRVLAKRRARSDPPGSDSHAGSDAAGGDQRRRRLAELHAEELAAVYDDAVRTLDEPVLLLIERSDSLGESLLAHYLPDRRSKPSHGKPADGLGSMRPGKKDSGDQPRLTLPCDYQVLAREHSEIAAWFDRAERLRYLTEAFCAEALAVRLLVVAFDGVTLCQIEL